MGEERERRRKEQEEARRKAQDELDKIKAAELAARKAKEEAARRKAEELAARRAEEERAAAAALKAKSELAKKMASSAAGKRDEEYEKRKAEVLSGLAHKDLVSSNKNEEEAMMKLKESRKEEAEKFRLEAARKTGELKQGKVNFKGGRKRREKRGGEEEG